MIEAHAGEITEYSEQAARQGTTVIVENLFANIPARRKFLKRDVTEASSISTIIEKIALSHPEVSFRFISDGALKFETPGDGKLENVIYIVMGKQMKNAMIYVDSEINDIRVQGYIGRSDTVKSNRNYQNFFINNRFIKSKLAVAAIEQAYTSYLPPEKFPCCVLNLTINPTTVDINVHPTKLEVKFANEKPVFEAIYHTVRTALEENTSRPEMVLSIPVSEERFERVTSQQYKTIAQARSVSDAFTPIVDSKQEERVEQIRYSDVPILKNESDTARETGSDVNKKYIPPEAIAMHEKYSNMPSEEFQKISPEVACEVYLNYLMYFREPIPKTPEEEAELAYMQEYAEDSDIDDPLDNMSVPAYRIVGEVFNSYLLIELDDKMLIVDKHAAHERIIFEKNKRMMKEKEPSAQILITPLEIMLTSAEISILNDYLTDFEKLGFKIQTRKYSILVSSIPTELASCDIQDTISTMVNRIKDGAGNPKLTRDILFEKALYQASCKAAIKAGREYVEAHTDWIVEQLMNIPDITFCPHGRPVAMEISKRNIDHQFERT